MYFRLYDVWYLPIPNISFFLPITLNILLQIFSFYYLYFYKSLLANLSLISGIKHVNNCLCDLSVLIPVHDHTTTVLFHYNF